MRSSFLVGLVALAAVSCVRSRNGGRTLSASAGAFVERCGKSPCHFSSDTGDARASLVIFPRERGFFIGYSHRTPEDELVAELWDAPDLATLASGSEVEVHRTHSQRPTPDKAALSLREIEQTSGGISVEVCFNGKCGESLSLGLSGEEFRAGTYNLENLWDDHDSSDAYVEYRGASTNWISEGMPTRKAKRVAEAVALMGVPEVLAVHELESGNNSGRAAEILFDALGRLGYTAYVAGTQEANDPDAVTSAIFTKFPVIRWGSLPISEQAGSGVNARDPVFADLDVRGKTLRVYAAHWLSKRGNDLAGQEEKRKKAATVLASHIEAARSADPSLDVMVMGDLNTNVNDTALLRMETALDAVLGSSGNEARIAAGGPGLYNLWYELPFEKRQSASYSSAKCSLDHILLAASLFDGKGIDYVNDSFRVTGSEGVARRLLQGPDGDPNRWRISREGSGFRHLGSGYADHLPLVARFRTDGAFRQAAPSSTIEREPRGDAVATEALPCEKGKSRFVSLADISRLGFGHEAILGHCLELDAVDLPLARNAEGLLSVRPNGVTLPIAFARDRGTECPTAKGRPAEVPTHCAAAEEFEFTAAGRRIQRVVGRIAWRDSVSAYSLLVIDPARDLVLNGETDRTAPVPTSLFPRCYEPHHALWTMPSASDLANSYNKCIRIEGLEVRNVTPPRQEGRDTAVVAELQNAEGRKWLVVTSRADSARFTGTKCRIEGFAALVDKGGTRLTFSIDGYRTGQISSLSCQ